MTYSRIFNISISQLFYRDFFVILILLLGGAHCRFVCTRIVMKQNHPPYSE